MFAEERKAEILQLMESGQPVKVGDLSQRFDVSESTIRRDLQELENVGLIQRTHGGAISVQSSFELSYQEKEIRFYDEKQKIAKAAVDLVKDGETVFLDTGTTTLQIAFALRGKTITVATNSMDIAQVFAEDPQVEVIVLGGSLRKNIRSLVGFLTNEMLAKLHFDKVFLAANAVDLELGVTTPNLMEAETKRHMVKAGKEVILVVDHSKLWEKAMCKICSLSEINLLLSDDGVDEADIKRLSEYVQVQIADNI
ncbi:DeoR/GlpR family DNA-binding transcription regulator [Desulfosporosinus metallidurans]|uniref:Putative regulator of fructose utilization, DeoR family n=1 Tax=Desulfosporosinus metallidurans TaxID=1888891 RepID=A0A1Q8QQY1_9FIRM|nr:DeoR/GlpR family DNA-binding transcription regulator [Desulfosporosinus metallidurans]OLN29726.1 putative regulator of fructose utilization, DeoR family [Desulfosporosinus metallidurans]